MTIPATPMGPEQDEEVTHEYFPTCLCEHSTTVQMSVPPQYDLYKEREAVTNLFLNVYGMLSYIQALEVRVDEDSDSDSGEQDIRQLSLVRDGDESTD